MATYVSHVSFSNAPFSLEATASGDTVSLPFGEEGDDGYAIIPMKIVGHARQLNNGVTTLLMATAIYQGNQVTSLVEVKKDGSYDCRYRIRGNIATLKRVASID